MERGLASPHTGYTHTADLWVSNGLQARLCGTNRLLTQTPKRIFYASP